MFKQDGGLQRIRAILPTKMSEFEAPNHLLCLFEVGIDLALINAGTHIGEDWYGKCEGSLTDLKIAELLNDDEIPQNFKTAFKQQTMIGLELLIIGKMTRGRRQCY